MREEVARTIVATAYALAIDDGLPLEQVAVIDGPEALYARLVLALNAPCVELLAESLRRSPRGRCAGC